MWSGHRRTAGLGALALPVLMVVAGCKEAPKSSGEPGPSSPGAAPGEPAAQPAASTPDAVQCGVIAILDVAPIYLGKQKGFFSARNIDLTITPAAGGAATIPGVLSGQMQFAFANVTSLLVAREKGLPVKVLTNGVSSTGEIGKDMGAVVVPGDSPIQSAKDLGGKTIAVNQLNNIGDTTVRASVKKAGGDAKAVKFVELPFPDMPPALENKRVDGAWVVEPFLNRAKSKGGRVVAWSFVDTAPKMTIAVYFTSEQLIASNPDLVKRFTEAMNESLAYAQEHPDEAREILKSYTKIPPEIIPELTLPLWPAEVNRESMKRIADLALEDGVLSKPPDLDAFLPPVK